MHVAILSTFIKLPVVIKIVFCLFEWPLKSGFNVTKKKTILAARRCTHMRICVHVGTLQREMTKETFLRV